jgi:citrate synthase
MERHMGKLHDKLAEQAPALREKVHKIVAEHGSTVVSEVTVTQVYGGMRGVKGLVCDTSLVEPEKGLVVRGIPIGDLTERLPEEIFYLLCTGELPDAEALASLQQELRQRAEVPSYVWDVLKALPADSHPMAMFSTAILSMERESTFRKRYSEGMHKTDYWEPTLDDALLLIARLPGIAAGIYRIHTKKGEPLPPDPNLDWGANYAGSDGRVSQSDPSLHDPAL